MRIGNGLAATAAAMALLAGHAAQAAEATASWWARWADPANRVALPDGRRINLYCEGKGGPVVVMDAGLGDTGASWRTVQDEIAKTVRVCVYDRAGLGFSTFDPGRRDTLAMTADLAAALKAARIKGPYVLVGHSMAGLNARVFASQHPKDVVGMVLVDPSVERQTERMAAASAKFAAASRGFMNSPSPCAAEPRPPEKEAACTTPRPRDLPADLAPVYDTTRSPKAYQAMMAEGASFSTFDSQQTAAASKPLGDMPLIVLTATLFPVPDVPADDMAAVGRVWNTMHDEVAALSTRGENRPVAGASHYIHRDKPQAVIDAVAEVVAAARAQRGARK